MNSKQAARTASLALGRSPYSKGAEKLAADLDRTLSTTEEAYIGRAVAFFNAGGLQWEGGDGWGFWLSGGTMSFGACSWCCKNAYSQTIAKCRGDAINAIRRLYIAGKNKELGAECVIV